MNVTLTEQEKIKLLNSDDVFAVMQKILHRENKIDKEKEHFWIIGLNTANRILFIELISMGSVKSTTVEPMNVFRVSVLKGATQVILCHNHPSGELKPSEGDKNVTDRLIQVGRILGIEVIDHLIISLNSYLSFGDLGLLEELRNSTEYIPTFEKIQKIKKEQQKLRREAVKVAEEKGLKKGRKEMAKSMKKDGFSIEVIKKHTKLSQQEIEKL